MSNSGTFNFADNCVKIVDSDPLHGTNALIP